MGAKKNEILLIADATNLPFKNNFFDRIIASEVLEHIPDDMKALNEMYRVLKPGGVIMVTVPNHDYPFLWDPVNWLLEKFWHFHLPSDVWWLSGIWADHFRLYFDKEMAKKINKAGFKIIRKWKTTHYCWPFSHFLFYGIGKNLIEKGWLKQFNRFENGKNISRMNKAVVKLINVMDIKNRESNNDLPCVNLVFKIIKVGEG